MNIDSRDNNSSEDAIIQKEYMKLSKAIIDKESKVLNRPIYAYIKTFGCQMNSRDSEKLEGILIGSGYTITENENDADLILFNTCTVRDNANRKVYGRLGRLKPIKARRPNLKIVLCGCMMQEETAVDHINMHYGFVNLIFGTHNIFDFARLLYEMLAKDEQIIDIWDGTDKIVEDVPVSRKYSFKSGINIMYGCNNFCTYCIVPYVRGRERSRPVDDIVSEVRHLASQGVVEIMLLGQNVNSYCDSKEDMSFPQLLRRLEDINGIERIRFMTSHPKDLSDELIEVMAESDKICRQLHLPFQSGSNKVLKLMNRGYTRETYINLIERIKNRIPDMSFSTDIIVGFPGELREDVNDTIDLINKIGYDNAFTFIYSKRSGTPAAKMEQLMNQNEIKEAFNDVLNAVRINSKRLNESYVGRTLSVLVEEVNYREVDLLTGRLSNNMLVHFQGKDDLIGKILKVRLNESKGFYYLGERL